MAARALVKPLFRKTGDQRLGQLQVDLREVQAIALLLHRYEAGYGSNNSAAWIGQFAAPRQPLEDQCVKSKARGCSGGAEAGRSGAHYDHFVFVIQHSSQSSPNTRAYRPA